jgi:hypothetical protein
MNVWDIFNKKKSFNGFDSNNSKKIVGGKMFKIVVHLVIIYHFLVL